jgi:hypothetical protein
MYLFRLTLLCASFALPRLRGKKYVNLANFRDACTVSVRFVIAVSTVLPGMCCSRA